MKKTISLISMGRVLMYALVTGAFLLVAAQDSSAQQTAQGGTNPYVSIAAKFGVTPYNLGKFERVHTVSILTQQLIVMKPVIAQGGGTQLDKFKYDYYAAIVGDVDRHYIAPEISMLTRLASVDNTNKVTGLQNWQLAQLYIQTVNLLQ